MSDSKLRRRCPKRIIGLLLSLSMAALVAGCATVRMGYNNLDDLSYWWLNAYVDFNGAQTPTVRDELTALIAWHRANELPRVAQLLARVEAAAPGDVTAEQVCSVYDEIRDRLLAVAVRAEPAATQLALSLGEAQLQTLAKKYAKNNAGYRNRWGDRTPAERVERRYDELLKREEDFYGRLEDAQRALLRRQAEQSQADVLVGGVERQRRQEQVMALLKHFQRDRPTAAVAQKEVHALVMRIAEAAPGSEGQAQRERQAESCRNVAALHATTSPAQRQRAAERLRAYRGDVEALMARQ
ncbi:MAG: DUF6279 family lipoprotein [Variovorax sp.]